jgi:hypothetical protein
MLCRTIKIQRRRPKEVRVTAVLFLFPCLIFAAVVGCSSGESPGVEPTQEGSQDNLETFKADPEEPVGSELSEIDLPEDLEYTSVDKVTYNIVDSSIINGWKMVTVGIDAYTTEDWTQYNLAYGEERRINYALHFPGNWELGGSVFHNEQGEKIAELFPALLLKPGQALLDNWVPFEGEEFISREEFNVVGLQGVRLITKVIGIGPGRNAVLWYAHKYFLSNGRQVAAITFYELTLPSEQKELLKQIIATMAFQ